MQKFKGIIYQVINIQNKKSYIGKTYQDFNNRKKQHLYLGGNSKYFYNALRKYGPHNFKWIILGEIESYNLEDLNQKLNEAEIESIWIFRTFGLNNKFDNIYGYNLTEGGEGILGYKHTKESKYKIALASIIMHEKLHPKSLITKECLGCHNDFIINENNGGINKKFCCIECYWLYMKGNKRSNYQKDSLTRDENISKGLTGKKLSKQHIENMSKSKTKLWDIDSMIIDYKSGLTFEQISKKYGIPPSTLSRGFKKLNVKIEKEVTYSRVSHSLKNRTKK